MVNIEKSQNKEMLALQNALIAQRKEETKLQNEIDMFSERSAYYENMYNQLRRECHELKEKCKVLLVENGNLKKSDINNLGSYELLKIIWRRAKARFARRRK